MELQQSHLYAKYVSQLGWEIIYLENIQIFIKRIPFYGTLAKMQRPAKMPTINNLAKLLKNHRVKTLAVEPVQTLSQLEYSRWITKVKPHVKINRYPFIPSKTIIVDLKPTEDEIFKRFSEAKRRAVRRALKHNLLIQESANINDLIKIKNKSSGLFGFITTYGIDKMWKLFSPKHAAILLAYTDHSSFNIHHSTFNVVGGILLIFWQKIAYYWVAGATKKGKKLFAPTLLVWKALKYAKKRGCTSFDFVGVYDERLPAYSRDWKGFTKFKEGFGGREVWYPIT